MKKKILALVLVVVLLLTAIGGTLAYFTDTDSADNQFVVGNVDIRLNESYGTMDLTGTEGYLNWLDDQLIVPGETTDKIVTVENLDTEDAWVRVTIVVPADMTANIPEGFKEIYSGAGMYQNEQWMYYEAMPNVYIFMGRVNAKTESSAVLESITLNADVTNQGVTEAYHVPVLVEAVQVTGFENDTEGAFRQLSTSNVKNYIDQYTVNDAFAALQSGDIVTVAEGTTLPQNLNNGVVLMGDLYSKTPVSVNLPTHAETGNHTIITSGSTFVNLHFTERLLVIGDATFINCTFDKGLWMTGVTGNVSLVGCTVEGADAGVDLLIDGAADGTNGGTTAHGRVIVEDCVINGSASIQGATSALYENCTFGSTGWSWKQIRINCPTTIETCTYTGELSYANGGNWALRIIPVA